MGHGDDIRTGRHRVFALHAHLVFVTKYGTRCSRPPTWPASRRSGGAVCADFGCELVRHY